MNKKLLPFILLIVIALFASSCSSVGQAQGQQTTSGEPAVRTLNVTGTATIYLTPDVAYISIGVHTENPEAGEAISTNNAQAQAVVDAIKAMGVDPKDIQTINFSIYPIQDYDPSTGESRGTRYAVDNTVYVTIRDINAIGDVITASTDAGANSINGITFGVVDRDAALIEARRQAIANARTMAEEMASAAGVSLGELQTISFYGGYPVSPMFEARGGVGMAMDSSVPISSGQLTLTVEVSVVYAID